MTILASALTKESNQYQTNYCVGCGAEYSRVKLQEVALYSS
jgi:hypothetical protein